MSAYTMESGEEIWATDGTEEGTVMLRDIHPGPQPVPFGVDHTTPKGLRASGGQVYFSADDGQSGEELWKTDGTPSGTVLVKDLNPGSSGSRPGGFMQSQGLTYFTANAKWSTNVPLQDAAVSEVWRSDGTSDGTFLLMNLPGATDNVGFHTLGSTTLFVRPHRFGSSPSGGYLEFPGEFFKTDGTPAGTVPWQAFPHSSFSPYAILGVISGNNLLYHARGTGNYPYNTGQLAGVKEETFIHLIGGDVTAHAFHDGGLTVQVWSSDDGNSLWSYQTNAGAIKPYPAVEADGITSLTSSGGRLFANYRGPYAARSGHEPWLLQSDGGASLMGDLNPGSTVDSGYAGPEFGPYSGNRYQKPFLLRGTFVFPALGDSGVEIWKSDGTVDGTTVLRDIIPGPDGHDSLIQPEAPYLSLVHQVGQLVYFIRIRREQPYGTELWVTDGTESGTRQLHEDKNNSINGILPWTGGVWWVEPGRTNADSNTVWLSDGTPAGTRPVKNVLPYQDGSGLSACFDGTTYTFLTKNGSTGSLWEIHPEAGRIRSVFEFVKPGDAPVKIRAMPVFDGGLHFFIQRQAGVSSPTPRAEI